MGTAGGGTNIFPWRRQRAGRDRSGRFLADTLAGLLRSVRGGFGHTGHGFGKKTLKWFAIPFPPKASFHDTSREILTGIPCPAGLNGVLEDKKTSYQPTAPVRCFCGAIRATRQTR